MDVPCGHWDDRARRRVRMKHVEPTGSWWQCLLCRLVCHQLACCPNHSTYVHDPKTDDLLGLLCERCGGLIR